MAKLESPRDEEDNYGDLTGNNQRFLSQYASQLIPVAVDQNKESIVEA